MGEGIATAAGSNLSAGLAIVAILFFVFGIVVGEHVGERVGERCDTRRQYWLANAGWLGGAMVVTALVAATGLIMLAALTLGLLAGGLTGTKLAYGESAGPWMFFDRKLRANKAHIKAAQDEAARARKQAAKEARRAGKPEPEYISVASNDTKTRSSRQRDEQAAKGKH